MHHAAQQMDALGSSTRSDLQEQAERKDMANLAATFPEQPPKGAAGNASLKQRRRRQYLAPSLLPSAKPTALGDTDDESNLIHVRDA